jgi:hypothetical protein
MFITEDSKLCISLRMFDPKESGYFNFNLYTQTFGDLCVVIPDEIVEECNLNFNSGIYLVDDDGVFVGVAEDYLVEKAKRGLYIKPSGGFSGDKDYEIPLSKLPENYKIKDILYVVYYKKETQNYDKEKRLTNTETTKECLLYKLPIKEYMIISGNTMLIPDYHTYRDRNSILLLYSKDPDPYKLFLLPFSLVMDQTVTNSAGIKKTTNIQELYSRFKI